MQKEIWIKATLPATNAKFWTEKISSNIDRDKRQQRELQDKGYKVLIVWQCELTADFCETTLNNLLKKLRESQ